MVAHHGHHPSEHESAEDALEALASGDFDLVITDLRMPGVDGLELCRRITEGHPDIPIIVLTAYPSMDNAIEAMRMGAVDFLSKPFTLESVGQAIERASHQRELRSEIRRLERTLRPSARGNGLVAASAAMANVVDLLARAAESEATVLLMGETGTGKEVAARELHTLSGHADGPFVAVNCAAIPEHLLESELFGHVKGSFTGASRDHTGLMVQATGGTLFLDEIGEMPLALQPKLLRAIQERVVRPVGGEEAIPFDTRLVAATNIDLEKAVEQGRFRQDLFFRINVVRIDLPPLRRRGQDVILLAQQFLEDQAKKSGKQVVGLTAAAAEKLMLYPWPGNVRELQNCIERAVALTQHDHLKVGDLPKEIADAEGGEPEPEMARGNGRDEPSHVPTLDEIERRHIVKVLNIAEGNKTQAARMLGLDRKTLYRRLKRYGLDGAA